jgi:hypothetical protein
VDITQHICQGNRKCSWSAQGFGKRKYLRVTTIVVAVVTIITIIKFSQRGYIFCHGLNGRISCNMLLYFAEWHEGQ